MGVQKAVAKRISPPYSHFQSCVLLDGLRGTGLSYLQGEKRIPELNKLGKNLVVLQETMSSGSCRVGSDCWQNDYMEKHEKSGLGDLLPPPT